MDKLDIPTMRYGPFSLEAASRVGAALRRRAGVFIMMVVAGGLLAGCQTDGPSSNPLSELAAYSSKKDEPAKTAAKPPEPPMTRSRAAMDCWMKAEKGPADANLDKRADAVTKCIDDKLKTAQAPKT